MVVGHRLAFDRVCRLRRFGHQPGLPQQLVTLQDEFLVPGAAVVAEGDADAAQPFTAGRGVVGGFRPGMQASVDRRHQPGIIRSAAVLPGEIPVPALPTHAGLAGGADLTRQAEIADGDHPLARFRPALVGEGVELLDIAERMVGLLLHPGPHAGLQRAVGQLERARR